MANPAFSSPINPHFFQPLLPGFHDHLNIPLRFFVNHIEGKNANTMAKLRSDMSRKTWEVKMVGRRFTDGWEDFANYHDFRVGDIIVFRHEGDMVFHVTGFGPSCCNLQYDIIEVMYQMPSGSDSDQDLRNISGEKKMEKNLREEAESSSSHSCFVAPVTTSNLRVDKLVLPRKFARSNGLNNRWCEIVLFNEHGRSWTLNLRHKSSNGDTYITRGWKSFCSANGQKAGGFLTLEMVKNGTTPVLQLSSKACGNTRFVTLTLTPTILRQGWSRLPVRFTRANGINKPGVITLQDKCGVEWSTTLWMAKTQGLMGLGTGLKGFLEAQGAQEGESFVFELSWRDTNPILKLCSKISRGTKLADRETVTKATAKAKQKVPETSTNPKVLVKEEQSAGAPWHEFGDPESGENFTPENRSEEMTIDSNKHCSRDNRISGECLKRKEKKTQWRVSSSPRQNRFLTLTLAPNNYNNSTMYIPTRFTRVNGIKKPRNIILMDKDGVKRASNVVLHNKRGAMRLSRGWRDFCEANDVKTGETFVLELIWEDTTPVLKFCSKVKKE